MSIVATAPSKVQALPAVKPQTRSFRLLETPSDDRKGIVRVTRGGKVRDFAFDLRRGGCDECHVSMKGLDPETRDAQHVQIHRDGSAMCYCLEHFDTGHCWHADLAAAIVQHLDAGKPEEPKAPALPTLEVSAVDGSPLCSIISESGLLASHRKLAELIRSKPFLLSNPEQREALEQAIAGTRIVTLDGPGF